MEGITSIVLKSFELLSLVTLEPAASGEPRRDAGCQQHETDGEGADDPA